MRLNSQAMISFEGALNLVVEPALNANLPAQLHNVADLKVVINTPT
jgi:hypothetical protein